MRKLFAVLFLLGIFVVSSCGRGSEGFPDTPEQLSPIAQTESDGNLLALDDLSLPEHELSVVGPGWFKLPPKSTLAANGVVPSGTPALELDAAAGHAFATYGVYGFDGDNGPTSARIAVANVTGEFYVAFSDYHAGTWAYAGPYAATVTAEIPNTDEYTSPTAFTSPGGVCYVSVIVPLGSAVTIVNIELGVHGGSLGPEAPLLVNGGGGDGGILLDWFHSSDYLDPDFAGYRVERAPLLVGDFHAIGPPDPIAQCNYLDDSCQMDVTYRYRVAAVDVHSNMSIWRNVQAIAESGTDTDPVPVLITPHGPLFGPVEVTFDLSQSYDPMNPGVPSPTIDVFTINFNHGASDISGGDPVMTATLQPGCYYYQAEVEVSGDGRSSDVTHQLVIYPQWRDVSTLVAGADSNTVMGRLFMPRAARHPVSGKMAIFAYDQTSMMFDIWYEDSPGRLDLHTLPTYGNWDTYGSIEYIGEPAIFGESIIAPVSTRLNIYVAVMSNAGPQWIGVANNEGITDVCAIACFGSTEAWVFYGGDNAGTPQLKVTEIISGESHVVITDCEDDLEDIAAVYNPSSGVVHVCYTTEGAGKEFVRYASWDPDANVVIDQTVPYVEDENAGCGWLDIEYDPTTQRPALLYTSYTDNRNHFRELTADDVTWTPDVIIDNTDDNGIPELAFGGTDDRPYAAFTVVNGANQLAHLFERDGGVWSMRNTASYSLDSGHGGALMTIPGSTDLQVVDVDSDGNTYVVTAHADGTDELLNWWQFGTDHLPKSDGQGFDMHGVGGSDGLHVVCDQRNTVPMAMISDHFTSPDGGVWTDVSVNPSPVDMGLSLAATVDGEVYLSGVQFPNHGRLFWWDGAVWQIRGSLVIDSNHHPQLLAQPADDTIHCAVYEDATGSMHYVDGNESGGYTDNVVLLNESPVWDGVIIPTFLGGRVCIDLTGGINQDDARLGVHDWDGNSFENLIDPLLPDPFFHLIGLETRGRSLDASYYMGNQMGFTTPVFWAAQGAYLKPIRYENPFFGDAIIAEVGSEINPFTESARRTVSAGLARGMTAVGLITSFDGKDIVFEWSHFGEWEDLPMPDLPEYCNNHELIIGMDGRWHIVYKDYLHDRIYCRSSLP